MLQLWGLKTVESATFDVFTLDGHVLLFTLSSYLDAKRPKWGLPAAFAAASPPPTPALKAQQDLCSQNLF